MIDEKSSAWRARGGKYLTFQLADEVFGIEILRVQEIIGMMRISSIPTVPPEVRGVINLRGKVIPVVDLRIKFGMEAKPDTERTCITVVQIQRANCPIIVGLVVDEVREVLDIEDNCIEPPPSFGGFGDTSFILGMAKISDEVVTLLEIHRVLSVEDLQLSSDYESTAAPISVQAR